jgi:hypothetical protein
MNESVTNKTLMETVAFTYSMNESVTNKTLMETVAFTYSKTA